MPKHKCSRSEIHSFGRLTWPAAINFWKAHAAFSKFSSKRAALSIFFFVHSRSAFNNFCGVAQRFHNFRTLARRKILFIFARAAPSRSPEVSFSFTRANARDEKHFHSCSRRYSRNSASHYFGPTSRRLQGLPKLYQMTGRGRAKEAGQAVAMQGVRGRTER